MGPGWANGVASSIRRSGSMMRARAPSCRRAEGQRSVARWPGRATPWWHRITVAIGASAASVALSGGCEPGDSYGPAAERGRDWDRAPAAAEPAEVNDAAVTADRPVAAEGASPLPPGWAEELDHLRRQETVAGTTPADPLAEMLERSPDGLELPRRERNDHSADALLGGLGSYNGPRAGPGGLQRGARLPADGRLPTALPRPKGDYTVMAVVILVPLAALIPVLCIWHVLRTLRAVPARRIGPVSSWRSH